MAHRPFIETQFPLAALSAESYKERKANLGQTLTGLGKWWGRKPLVLVRAVLLGILMPASEDPHKDLEVFLRILTMDADGLLRRKNKPLPAARVGELVSSEEAQGVLDSAEGAPRWVRGCDTSARARLEQLAFNRMPYEERIAYCLRPEQIEGPSAESFRVINEHLGTGASTLVELFAQLSERGFGRALKVGDVFCGGGSIPFEAARLGFETWGSDLSPVAALLTWASIHLVGGGAKIQEEVKAAQEEAFREADRQIREWGIEHDGNGNRADAYLYCVEAKSPATEMWVPLAPSWVIGERTRTVAKLAPNAERSGYDIEIRSGASKAEMAAARRGTVEDSDLVCPETGSRYSIAGLRGPNGLRLWENDDLVPRPDDTLRERLYCVRWVTPDGEREYRSVTAEDLAREERVLALLRERFTEWQEKGFIPSMQIRRGYNTEQPIRERGWTHWHHLFHPRQLLVHGLLAQKIATRSGVSRIVGILWVAALANRDSRLVGWVPSLGVETTDQVFSNQALNTKYNFGARGVTGYLTVTSVSASPLCASSAAEIKPQDARSVHFTADLWITDPPYADAVNYHELGDFFLAWYEKHLPRLFPYWYSDGRAALAVKGSDEDFKRSMVEIYANLAAHMADDGLQVVMFTHQDAGVWADLGMILWAAGLKVTAAWTIGTETSSALRKGNYVQGTVLLVLRKRVEDRTVYLDELYPMVDDEVRGQLDRMHSVDDDMTPEFGDTDYQLGAYAAALRVLTAYADIEGQDIRHELFRARAKDEKSPFERIIDRAVSIAANYLVPRGIETHVWRNLSAYERLYLRGIELERHGELRQGAYMELARGFGVHEYRFLLGSDEANRARCKRPSEFGRGHLADDDEWGSTLLRHLLYSVALAAETDNPREGLNYLKNARQDYWTRRADIQAVLLYLEQNTHFTALSHWKDEAAAAQLLRGLVANDYGGS